MVGGSLQLPPPLKTGTGSHDIAEILLKVALKHKKINQIKSILLNLIFDITYKREKNRCY
jgi:hypothetical protein